MRFFAAICCMVVSVAFAGAQVSYQGLKVVSISGQDHVKLTDWAKTNRFALKFSPESEQVDLTTRWSSISFTANSKRATVNDISVFLSLPVVLHDHALYLSTLDLQKTILPILSPPKNTAGSRVRTICIDPGHGGKDPGFVEGDTAEKFQTLFLARELADFLKHAGFKVILTRNSDEFVDLSQRAEMAKRQGADLFVSLHYNAAARESAGGVEVFCMPPAGASSTNGDSSRLESAPGNRNDERNALLAFHIQSALVKRLRLEDRGVRRARFAVLRSAEMPAVLVEAGFMSNPLERQKIYHPEFRKLTAFAIAEGIVAYQRLVER